MYNTYYLKFNSEASWDAKAAELGYRHQDPDTGAVTYSVTPGAIDVVGVIYNDTGEIDVEGEPVPPTPVDGWHVNIRLKAKYETVVVEGEKDTIRDVILPEVLNNYIVEPQTPSRVFA